MASTNFYQALQENIRLLAQIEAADGEMTEEVMELLSLSESKILDSAIRMLELRDTAHSQVIAAEMAIVREQERKAQFEKNIALLDKRLGLIVDQIGPLTLGSHSVSYTESQASDVTDPDLLPRDYQRFIPSKLEPDRAKILKDLKAGKDVPGAQLKTNRKLKIK